MTATRTYTVKELERTPPPGDWELDDWELIDGVLSVVPLAGVQAAAAIVKPGCLVGDPVYPRRLGDLYLGAGFKLFPDRETLLGPSFSFVARERLPPERQSGFLRVPPDLAIDVVGPFRTVAWALRRVALYLEAGVRLVGIVDPIGKGIAVARPDRFPQTLGADDTLPGGDVLPGFADPVAEIFA